MPRNMADQLARKFLTRDPFEIARALNRTVVEKSLCDVRGLCLQIRRNFILFIDNRLEGFERELVCAHELGHSLLHGEINSAFLDSRTHFVKAKYEAEADRFALDLVMPDNLFSEYADMPVPDISEAMRISEELAEYRLLKYKRLL